MPFKITKTKDNSVKINKLNDEYKRIIAARNYITETSSPFFDSYPSSYAMFDNHFVNTKWTGNKVEEWKERFPQLYLDTASKLISDIATLKDDLLSLANSKLYQIDELED